MGKADTIDGILELLNEGVIIKGESFILFARLIGAKEDGQHIDVPDEEFPDWLENVIQGPYVVGEIGELFTPHERGRFHEWLSEHANR